MHRFGWLSYRAEKDNQVFGDFIPAGLLVFECPELSICLVVIAHCVEFRKNIVSPECWVVGSWWVCEIVAGRGYQEHLRYSKATESGKTSWASINIKTEKCLEISNRIDMQ